MGERVIMTSWNHSKTFIICKTKPPSLRFFPLHYVLNLSRYIVFRPLLKVTVGSLTGSFSQIRVNMGTTKEHLPCNTDHVLTTYVPPGPIFDTDESKGMGRRIKRRIKR